MQKNLHMSLQKQKGIDKTENLKSLLMLFSFCYFLEKQTTGRVPSLSREEVSSA